jgi:hypothetical protein
MRLASNAIQNFYMFSKEDRANLQMIIDSSIKKGKSKAITRLRDIATALKTDRSSRTEAGGKVPPNINIAMLIIEQEVTDMYDGAVGATKKNIWALYKLVKRLYSATEDVRESNTPSFKNPSSDHAFTCTATRCESPDNLLSGFIVS